LETEITLTKTEKPNFQFTHSPIINKIHLLQIEFNLYLKQAMQRDLTDTFMQDLDFRVSNERNLDLVIHGETGSGKSRLAMTVYWEIYDRARKINPKLQFNSDNICFTRTEWLERSEKLTRGDTLLFDEDDQSKIGTGSLRQITEQERIEKTLRQSQFNFIFCSPLVEQHVEHYILQAFDMDFDKRLNRAVVMKRDLAGLILPYGYVILEKHEAEGYEAKKKKFRKSVQDRKVSDRFKEYDSVGHFMIEKLHIDKLKKRTQKSLIQRYFPRFVEEEVKEIMTSIELIGEKVKLPDYSEF